MIFRYYSNTDLVLRIFTNQLQGIFVFTTMKDILCFERLTR